LHGCSGLYGQSGDLTATYRHWAERLSRAGYVVLLPDSFTPRDIGEVCTRKDRPVQPSRERTADAFGALAWLGSLPFVQPDRIGLLGWSHGGSTVLSTVDATGGPRAAGLRDAFRTAVAFYPGCTTSLRDPGWRPRVSLHILIGRSDDWTPAAPCVALGERARSLGDSMEVVVFEGAYHSFDAPGIALRVRHGIATTRSGTATVGTNEEARRSAIERVERILRDTLAK
jgi:dienelactone hydrolase